MSVRADLAAARREYQHFVAGVAHPFCNLKHRRWTCISAGTLESLDVEISQHKQYDWCATASYWPSIRAPESEQYFAVPGQEILGLLGCKDIYIEYFQRFFIKCQRKEEDKPKT